MPAATESSREEPLLEYVSSAGAALGVEPGVIRGVKVLGLRSGNGRTYKHDAIQKAAALYEGAKINVNHPAKGRELEPRSYQDRLGYLKGVQVREDGLYADLHYNPKHPIAEQLAWDAANAPSNVGLSHNAVGKTRRENGQFMVEEIVSVKSVDLVAEPATTRGLFESLGHPHEEDMSVETLTLEELQAKNKPLVDKIKADALAESRQSESTKALEAENKKLREKLDAYEAGEKLAQKRAAIDAKLAEAKLPAELVTDVFKQSLLEAKDDAAVGQLIEDRRVIARQLGARGSAPVSRSAHDAGGGAATAAPKDAKEFAARLRG